MPNRFTRPFSLYVICMGLVMMLGCGGGSPEDQAVTAIREVIESAYEKNPQGIQAQLRENPQEAKAVFTRVVFAQPQVQNTLRRLGVWEQREELLRKAVIAFAEDNEDINLPPGVLNPTESSQAQSQ